MRIFIVHDSQFGNGEKLAQRMAQALRLSGAEVQVGHQKDTPATSVREFGPDLLVVGAAVRKFLTGPASTGWTRRLAAIGPGPVPLGAVFITHVMPDRMVARRGERFMRRIRQSGAVANLYGQWLSGRVADMSGPFVEGTMEEADRYSRELVAWAAAQGPAGASA